VREKTLAVLEGRAGIVAGSITRKATALGLTRTQRVKADQCAHYPLAKCRYLGYPSALAKGRPIATGVIEGACRHLVVTASTSLAHAGAYRAPRLSDTACCAD
jgi:hypothetical protein